MRLCAPGLNATPGAHRRLIAMNGIAAYGALILMSFAGVPSPAQQEVVSTQVLVTAESKRPAEIAVSAVTVKVDNRNQPVKAWAPLDPAKTQVAVLMDQGLRLSVGRELDTLRDFVKSLPEGLEVMVGAMQYGSVRAEQTFTTDHNAAAASLRLPVGSPAVSGSPYLCLSDFVQKWPESSAGGMGQKARIVLMITNGVDPYNGSTSVMNQDSPYVKTAVRDAQRAGVAVYSIYYGDAGFRGSQASLSGQGYLAQVADATGGSLFYQGSRSPVSMEPFLEQFKGDLAQSYVATFDVPSDRKHDLVRVKVSAEGAKVRAPEAVRPGNRE